MGLITETVKITPKGNQISYFRNLGYVFENGDEIEVKVSDLSKGSHISIQCKCDYCEKIINMDYSTYIRNTSSIVKKIACYNCRNKKVFESNMIKYGVKSVLSLDEVREKSSKTCMQKYGVSSYSQTPEYIEHIKKTCIDRYGTEWGMQNETIKERVRNTCMNKYGVPNVLLNDEIKQRIKNTVKERYNVDNISQSKDIQRKKEQTLLNHYGVRNPTQSKEIQRRIIETNLNKYNFPYALQINNIPSSIQQIYVCKLYNMILNYPILGYTVDMIDLTDNNICEYDGSGHALSVQLGSVKQEEFEYKQIKRNYTLKNLGYKVIRIISNKDFLPSDTILLQMLSDAKQYFSDYPEHSWIQFNIDDGIVRNAENKDGVPYFYGELRKIKKSDIPLSA